MNTRWTVWLLVLAFLFPSADLVAQSFAGPDDAAGASGTEAVPELGGGKRKRGKRGKAGKCKKHKKQNCKKCGKKGKKGKRGKGGKRGKKKGRRGGRGSYETR